MTQLLLLITLMMKMRRTIHLKAVVVKLVGGTTDCINIPLDYIMGLN